MSWFLCCGVNTATAALSFTAGMLLPVSSALFLAFSWSRAKHGSDPGGSGRGHQRDCEALPQARKGGETV